MNTKLKKNLKARIELIQNDDQIFSILNHLGFAFDEDEFADEMVWARIKTPNEVQYLTDDEEKNNLTNGRTQQFATATKGVKLFLIDDWYINRDFNLKLRPNWVELIQENKNE
jgi:galactose mutarotase-like enzyme